MNGNNLESHSITTLASYVFPYFCVIYVADIRSYLFAKNH